MTEVQFGESAYADFEENTWTFEFPESYKVSAGKYAVVPTQQYDAMVMLCRKFSSGMPIEAKTIEEQNLYRDICQHSRLSTE
jgi:hypothetical protein